MSPASPSSTARAPGEHAMPSASPSSTARQPSASSASSPPSSSAPSPPSSSAPSPPSSSAPARVAPAAVDVATEVTAPSPTAPTTSQPSTAAAGATPQPAAPDLPASTSPPAQTLGAQASSASDVASVAAGSAVPAQEAPADADDVWPTMPLSLLKDFASLSSSLGTSSTLSDDTFRQMLELFRADEDELTLLDAPPNAFPASPDALLAFIGEPQRVFSAQATSYGAGQLDARIRNTVDLLRAMAMSLIVTSRDLVGMLDTHRRARKASQAAATSSQLARAEAEQGRLKRELAGAFAESERLTQELASLRAKYEGAKAQLDSAAGTHRDEVAKLSALVASLSDEKGQLVANQAQAAVDLARSKTRLRDTTRELAEARATLANTLGSVDDVASFWMQHVAQGHVVPEALRLVLDLCQRRSSEGWESIFSAIMLTGPAATASAAMPAGGSGPSSDPGPARSPSSSRSRSRASIISAHTRRTTPSNLPRRASRMHATADAPAAGAAGPASELAASEHSDVEAGEPAAEPRCRLFGSSDDAEMGEVSSDEASSDAAGDDEASVEGEGVEAGLGSDLDDEAVETILAEASVPKRSAAGAGIADSPTEADLKRQRYLTYSSPVSRPDEEERASAVAILNLASASKAGVVPLQPAGGSEQPVSASPAAAEAVAVAEASESSDNESDGEGGRFYRREMPALFNGAQAAYAFKVNQSWTLEERYFEMRKLSGYCETFSVAAAQPIRASRLARLLPTDLVFAKGTRMGLSTSLPPADAEQCEAWRSVINGWKVQRHARAPPRPASFVSYPAYTVHHAQTRGYLDSFGDHGERHLLNLMDQRPWDAMWRDRVRRLYLLDPDLLDVEGVRWLETYLHFMFSHRQAMWEHYHWLATPRHDHVPSEWALVLRRREKLASYLSAAWSALYKIQPPSWLQPFTPLVEQEPALWFRPPQHCSWVPASTNLDPSDPRALMPALAATDHEEPLRIQFAGCARRFVESLGPRNQVALQFHHYVGVSWGLPGAWSDDNYWPMPAETRYLGTPGPDFYRDTFPTELVALYDDRVRALNSLTKLINISDTERARTTPAGGDPVEGVRRLLLEPLEHQSTGASPAARA